MAKRRPPSARDKRKRTRSQGGPPAHRQSVERIEEDRRLHARLLRAMEMHLAHMTMRQIAAQLGITEATVCRDIQMLHEAEEREFTLENHHLRKRQAAVISRAMRALLPDLTHDRPSVRHEASDRIVALLSREAKLLGLDHRVETGESPERVLALVKGITELIIETVSDPSLVRRIVEGIRARLRPALAGEVVSSVRVAEAAAVARLAAGDDGGSGGQ